MRDASALTLPAANPVIRAGGLPIRLLAADVIRRVRAAAAKPAPATPDVVPPAILAQVLRGFSLIDLYVEARRCATEAAAAHEHLEGLAAGRAYGDPQLQPGFLTPDSYRRAAAEARRRAEMAGATADVLRGLLGLEAGLAELLAGDAHA